MNAKQSKALRAGLREFAKIQNPERAAEHRGIEHHRTRKLEDGSYGSVLIGVTARLAETCPRGIYQRAKRGIKHGGLDFKAGGLHKSRLRNRVLGFLGDGPEGAVGEAAGSEA